MLQAKAVAATLAQHLPNLTSTLCPHSTLGDQQLDKPMAQLENAGVGVFVKELETALLAHQVDAVVHCLKDLPSVPPKGLALQVIGQRATPNDVWLCPQGVKLEEAPAGWRVGTSALRRQAMVRAVYPQVALVPLRGNLQTRWAKVLAGEADGLILAAAGVERLAQTDPHWAQRVTQLLPAEVFVPAVGQGWLALQYRQADEAWLADVLRALAVPSTQTWLPLVEREVMRVLEGGCQLPLGVWARPHASQPKAMTVSLCLLSPNGQFRLEATRTLPCSPEALPLAEAWAKQVLTHGGATLKATCLK
jgi:hydroxymethylbilane synthase